LSREEYGRAAAAGYDREERDCALQDQDGRPGEWGGTEKAGPRGASATGGAGAKAGLNADLFAHILQSSYFLEAELARSEKATTIVSTKGQVILPKAIRREKQWDAGTRLTVENTEEGVLLKAAPPFASAKIEDVFASLKAKGPAKTLEEMDAAIAAEARRRARN
jgi:AbrB family looped-hinge helix DNA binding protein